MFSSNLRNCRPKSPPAAFDAIRSATNNGRERHPTRLPDLSRSATSSRAVSRICRSSAAARRSSAQCELVTAVVGQRDEGFHCRLKSFRSGRKKQTCPFRLRFSAGALPHSRLSLGSWRTVQPCLEESRFPRPYICRVWTTSTLQAISSVTAPPVLAVLYPAFSCSDAPTRRTTASGTGPAAARRCLQPMAARSRAKRRALWT